MHDSETYFKHANRAPAPLPQPSPLVDLNDGHRQAMRARLYGRRGLKKPSYEDNVFKAPYADEAAPAWQSVTTSDYHAKHLSHADINMNQAAAELKATHFKIEDPSISGTAKSMASSVMKSDFAAPVDPKVTLVKMSSDAIHNLVGIAREFAQPYPVIFRDDSLATAKSSLYKSDFDSKYTGEKVYDMADDRANMRATHFTLGNNTGKELYVSEKHASEVKNLPADVFREISDPERRNGIKKAQIRPLNLLEFVDHDKEAWKTTQKSEFVDFTKKVGYHTVKHSIDEDLRKTHFELGDKDLIMEKKGTVYAGDFALRPAEQRILGKPKRATSTEGLQLKWADLPSAIKKSINTTEYVAHKLDDRSKETAKALKEFSSKTSISFAHPNAELAAGAPRSVTSSDYSGNSKFVSKMERAHAAPPNVLWEEEVSGFATSVAKTDYADPLVKDPQRKVHYLQGKFDLKDKSGLLRMTNFSLGTDSNTKSMSSTYDSNYADPKSAESFKLYKKPFDGSSQMDRVVPRYPEAMGPSKSVYQEQFSKFGKAQRAEPCLPEESRGLQLHHAGYEHSEKESVTRRTYVLPELMIDRSVRRP